MQIMYTRQCMLSAHREGSIFQMIYALRWFKLFFLHKHILTICVTIGTLYLYSKWLEPPKWWNNNIYCYKQTIFRVQNLVMCILYVNDCYILVRKRAQKMKIYWKKNYRKLFMKSTVVYTIIIIIVKINQTKVGGGENKAL